MFKLLLKSHSSSQIEFYVKICYTPYAGSEGKAFVGNVMPDKATG